MRLIILSFFFTACTQMCSKNHNNMSAEEVLETYLNLAFNFDEEKDKNQLIEYTTDELKQAIAGMNKDVIEEAYIQKKYDLQKFYIVSRKDLTPRECEITFRLVYTEKQIPDSANVTTENTIFMRKEEGKWLIAKVIGNRTSFDFPVSKSSQITPAKEGK